MCAITLLLKMIRRYPPLAGLACAAVTLLSGLLLNRQGWTGVLPVLAGTGVVFRHSYHYRSCLPAVLFPEGMWEKIQRQPMILLSRIDNANRMRGQSHALDLLLENIVAVALWGAYAWLMGDICMLCWRAVLLLLNLVDYCKRMKRILNCFLNGFIPSGGENKRRRYSGQSGKRHWSI